MAEDPYVRAGMNARKLREALAATPGVFGRALVNAGENQAVSPFGVNLPAVAAAGQRFRSGYNGPEANPMPDELVRLRNRGAVMSPDGRALVPPSASDGAGLDGYTGNQANEVGARLSVAGGTPPGRLSPEGTNYLRSGEVPERRVYESRGGTNAPGNAASDVEAGLARSPIMAMAARMRAAKIQEGNDALDEQQRGFISQALQSAALTSGDSSFSQLLNRRANLQTAMGLERNRTARSVAEGKNATDLNVANIGAGATLGAAGQRARASELAARLGLAGQQSSAQARENAARIAAAGQVGAAQVNTLGRRPTLDQVAAELYQQGDTSLADKLHQPKQPQAARVTAIPGVPGLSEGGAIIAQPGEQPSFRTQKELSDLTKRQDLTAAVDKIDTKGKAPGTKVKIPGHPQFEGVVGEDGSVQVVPIGANK